MIWKRLTFRGGLERDVCSSFPSNRFDMAPLWYVVPLLIELPRSTGSEDGRDWGVPAKYIEAFPFPGRAAGRRLTITEDDRGIIWESSLCSSVGRTGEYSRLERKAFKNTCLVWRWHRRYEGQSHWPYPYCWQVWFHASSQRQICQCHRRSLATRPSLNWICKKQKMPYVLKQSLIQLEKWLDELGRTTTRWIRSWLKNL